MDDAVGEIAGGAAEQNSEGHGIDPTGIAGGDQQPGDQGHDQERTNDQENARGHARGIREDAESNAGVFGIDDGEIVWNDNVRKKTEGARFDPGFGGAVKQNHKQGEREPAETAWQNHEAKAV